MVGMKAELISIGDELLIGQTINTNVAWIGEKLNEIGVSVIRTQTITDEADEIKAALDSAFSRVDLVISTGGLGPTNDDITKNVLAEYFDSKMHIDQPTLDHVAAFFAKWNRPMLEVNRLQAMVPDKCEVLKNDMGTAPGMWFDVDGKVMISMPGVPFEAKHLLIDRAIPKIVERFNTDAVYHKTILTVGMGESFLAEKIKDFENSLAAEDIKLAYLPSSDGRVKLRLSSVGADKDELVKKTTAKQRELETLIPKLIYGYDTDLLEDVVGDLLMKHKLKIATAESCTGGYIAHKLTSKPGSSAYYEGSAVTYSYNSKSKLLNVPNELIVSKGAVSEEVVREMALGLFDSFDIDYAIAVSGIAGPGGGTVDKPVGTVWMAVGTKENMVTRKFNFGNHRKFNIKVSATMALNMLRLQLLERF